MNSEQKAHIYQMIENMDIVVATGAFDFHANLVAVKALFNTSEFREPKPGEVWKVLGDYYLRVTVGGRGTQWLRLSTSVLKPNTGAVLTFVADNLEAYYAIPRKHSAV